MGSIRENSNDAYEEVGDRVDLVLKPIWTNLSAENAQIKQRVYRLKLELTDND